LVTWSYNLKRSRDTVYMLVIRYSLLKEYSVRLH